MKLKNSILILLLCLTSIVHAQYGKFRQLDTDSIKVGGKWHKKLVDNLNDAIKGGSKLDTSAMIDAGDSSFAIAAGSFAVKGKGLNTMIGVLSEPENGLSQATLTMNTADSMGLPLVRISLTASSNTLTTTQTAYKVIKAANKHNIQLNIRNYASDGTHNFCPDSERAGFVAMLDTLIRNSIKGTKTVLSLSNNEPENGDYNALDTSRNVDGTLSESNSARRYFFNELKPQDSLYKLIAPEIKTGDGAFTGKSFYYLVWKDLIDSGRTADALKFAYQIWTSSELTSLYNGTWATFVTRANIIAMERQLIPLLKNSTIDYVNFHLKARLNGIDSAHINPIIVSYPVDFLQRMTGKKVISNEVGSKSTNPAILQELIQGCVDAGMDYVVGYDGTSRTNGNTNSDLDVSWRDSDLVTINSIGQGVKAQHTVLKNAVNAVIKIENGKVNIPGAATSETDVVFAPDQEGNMITKKVAGMATDTSHLRADINSTISALDYKVPSVADIAALLSFQRGNNTTVQVRDAARGGVFNIINSGTVDSGVIFRSTDGTLWQRDVSQSGVVYPEWWGAKADGVTDDGPAIRKMRDYVYSLRKRDSKVKINGNDSTVATAWGLLWNMPTMVFRGKSYLIRQSIFITSGMHAKGYGTRIFSDRNLDALWLTPRGGTNFDVWTGIDSIHNIYNYFLTGGGAKSNADSIYSQRDILIEGFKFDGNNSAYNGLRTDMVSNSVFRDCEFVRFNAKRWADAAKTCIETQTNNEWIRISDTSKIKAGDVVRFFNPVTGLYRKAYLRISKISGDTAYVFKPVSTIREKASAGDYMNYFAVGFQSAGNQNKYDGITGRFNAIGLYHGSSFKGNTNYGGGQKDDNQWLRCFFGENETGGVIAASGNVFVHPTFQHSKYENLVVLGDNNHFDDEMYCEGWKSYQGINNDNYSLIYVMGLNNHFSTYTPTDQNTLGFYVRYFAGANSIIFIDHKELSGSNAAINPDESDDSDSNNDNDSTAFNPLHPRDAGIVHLENGTNSFVYLNLHSPKNLTTKATIKYAVVDVRTYEFPVKNAYVHSVDYGTNKSNLNEVSAGSPTPIEGTWKFPLLISGGYAWFDSTANHCWHFKEGSTLPTSDIDGISFCGGSGGSGASATPVMLSLSGISVPADSTVYNAITGSNVSYVAPSSLNNRIVVSPVAGMLKYLHVKTSAVQPSSGALVVSVYKNGVVQPLAVTIAASAAAGTYSNLTDSVVVSKGDVLTYQFRNYATGNSAGIQSVSSSFAGSTGVVNNIIGNYILNQKDSVQNANANLNTIQAKQFKIYQNSSDSGNANLYVQNDATAGDAYFEMRKAYSNGNRAYLRFSESNIDTSNQNVRTFNVGLLNHANGTNLKWAINRSWHNTTSQDSADFSIDFNNGFVGVGKYNPAFRLDVKGWFNSDSGAYVPDIPLTDSSKKVVNSSTLKQILQNWNASGNGIDSSSNCCGLQEFANRSVPFSDGSTLVEDSTNFYYDSVTHTLHATISSITYTDYATSGTPTPAVGHAITWFDGTSLKVTKNVGGTITTATIF